MMSRTRWTQLAAFVLIGAGAGLRLRGLDAMEFKLDELTAIDNGIQLLRDRPWASAAPWPTHGMLSSNHVGNAPLFTWVVAGAWRLWPHPVGVAALIALVNAVSLVPLLWWARRRMDEPRALLTLGVAAVSPIAVLLGRKIWAQDVLLPGILCALWGIEWLRGGRPWRGAALVGAAALVMGQLHQSGPIALVLLPIAFAVHGVGERDGAGGPPPRRGPSRGEGLALALVLAANAFFWLPHLGYLWSLPLDTWSARPMLTATEAMTLPLLRRVARQVAPLDLFDFFYLDRADFLADPLRAAVFWASVGLGAPLGAYGIWRWLRAPRSLPVVGVWWWAVIAVFALARIPVHMFYVVVLAPLVPVLAAGAFDAPARGAWTDRLRLAWRGAYVAVLLALTLVTQSWLERRGGGRGDFGVTYAVRSAQADAAIGRLEPAWPAPVALPHAAPPGDNTALACHELPDAVQWIAHWKHPEAGNLPGVTLCDGWSGPEGSRVYRWRLADD